MKYKRERENAEGRARCGISARRVVSLYGNDSDMPLSGAVKIPSITILYYFQTSYTGPSIEDSSGGRLPLLEGTVTGLTIHLNSCNKCLERTQNIPDLEIYVRRVDPFFALTLSDITINIQVQKIEEEKYNQCSIVLLWLPVCTFIIRTYVSYFEKFQS